MRAEEGDNKIAFVVAIRRCFEEMKGRCEVAFRDDLQ